MIVESSERLRSMTDIRPQIFASRMWGFDPETHPIVMASNNGYRDSLRKAAKPGDLVLFVGTKGPPTLEEEQGRLLGLATFEDTPIDTLDVCSRGSFEGHHFVDGQFKWPKALPILRAWRFEPRPLLTDIFERQLPRSATLGFFRLGDRDRDAVLSLEKREINVPLIEAVARNAYLREATLYNRNGATTGPLPTSGQSTTVRTTAKTAFTYAMRFGRTDIWKFGWCFDPELRKRRLNAHIPTELISDEWTVAYRQAWPCAQDAYRMEQQILLSFAEQRTIGERVRVAEKEVMPKWLEAIRGSRLSG